MILIHKKESDKLRKQMKQDYFIPYLLDMLNIPYLTELCDNKNIEKNLIEALDDCNLKNTLDYTKLIGIYVMDNKRGPIYCVITINYKKKEFIKMLNKAVSMAIFS